MLDDQDTPDLRHQPNKSSTPIVLAFVLILLAAGAVYFFYLRDTSPQPEAQVVKPVVVQPAPAALPEPEPEPVYEPPAPVVQVKPLPALNESDAEVKDALMTLRGEGLLRLIVSKELIRKFVLGVNAVAEGKVVTEYRPINTPAPSFFVEKVSATVDGEVVEQERIASKNYTRYEAYVTTLALIDTDAAVLVYKRFYPLLEEAYKELGLKRSNFHTVFMAAIENILSAPDVEANTLLIHPKVFYQFADPALEKLPQTHKLMIRMGPENARSVKASLRQLKAKLI